MILYSMTLYNLVHINLLSLFIKYDAGSKDVKSEVRGM